jgi:hypothetical protein
MTLGIFSKKRLLAYTCSVEFVTYFQNNNKKYTESGLPLPHIEASTEERKLPHSTKISIPYHLILVPKFHNAILPLSYKKTNC